MNVSQLLLFFLFTRIHLSSVNKRTTTKKCIHKKDSESWTKWLTLLFLHRSCSKDHIDTWQTLFREQVLFIKVIFNPTLVYLYCRFPENRERHRTAVLGSRTYAQLGAMCALSTRWKQSNENETSYRPFSTRNGRAFLNKRDRSQKEGMAAKIHFILVGVFWRSLFFHTRMRKNLILSLLKIDF